MQLILQKQIRGVVNFLVLALVLAVITSALSFNISLGLGYYIIIVTAFLVLLLFSSNEKKWINTNTILLLFAILLSILLNNVPSYFSAYPRFFMFVIILYMLGPFIQSKTLMYFRKRVFRLILKINIALCSLSFVGLVTGLYKGITINRFGNLRVDFTGFFNHSMLLSPLSGVSVITCFYIIYNENNNKKKAFYICCAVLSLMSAITAGSRSALLGIMAGTMFFLYKVNKGKIGKYLRTLFVIFGTMIVTFPLWQERTEFLLTKVNSSQTGDLAFDSRTVKWEQRLKEFKSSPLYGIGFGAVDVNGMDYFDKETGTVEPGSSWLAILSMTGLFAFMPIVTLFFSHFKFIYKDEENKIYSAFLGGLLVLLTLHMMAEGYVYASGALLCIFLWLLLGIIEDQKKLNIKL